MTSLLEIALVGPTLERIDELPSWRAGETGWRGKCCMAAHDRIYIDGCLDMMHHGHTGAIRQAKTMGKYLVCGVHSDEEIAVNKGIPVMNADERYTAAAACKWVDEVAEGAPYVMDLDFMDAKGCQFVVHGDDITTDANGVDCYREVKEKGRFLVCKRTPAISTTDLVGRMLLHTRDHHYPADSDLPYGEECVELYRLYAMDTDATSPRTPVYRYKDGKIVSLVAGRGPASRQEVVYADGGWDLFTPGHMEMLKSVRGGGENYVVVGVHNDGTIHDNKGFSYPIMNMKERALTLLACRYVDAVILEVPYKTTKELLSHLPYAISAVYHGPLPLPAEDHGYEDVKEMLKTVDHHRFEDLNAQTIVKRIIARSDEYLERQRKKNQKATNEAMLRAAEVGRPTI